jgi:hypothetical protein
MLSALTELVRYEPVESDIYDLEDAPVDLPNTDGDNSTLADMQPRAVRPSDIGESE